MNKKDNLFKSKKWQNFFKSRLSRHMHPKILKGLSLGVSFQFFEYLGFEFEFEKFAKECILQISCKFRKR